MRSAECGILQIRNTQGVPEFGMQNDFKCATPKGYPNAGLGFPRLQSSENFGIADIILDESKVGMMPISEEGFPAKEQIVHDRDMVPSVQQHTGEQRTNVASAARDQDVLWLKSIVTERWCHKSHHFSVNCLPVMVSNPAKSFRVIVSRSNIANFIFVRDYGTTGYGTTDYVYGVRLW